MFMPATYMVHTPALSLPEAAMLPALAGEESLPRNLLLPDRRIYHPMPQSLPAQAPRRGSMAGRAVLACIKSAPVQRRER